MSFLSFFSTLDYFETSHVLKNLYLYENIVGFFSVSEWYLYLWRRYFINWAYSSLQTTIIAQKYIFSSFGLIFIWGRRQLNLNLIPRSSKIFLSSKVCRAALWSTCSAIQRNLVSLHNLLLTEQQKKGMEW